MGWYYPGFLQSLTRVSYRQVFLYSFLWDIGIIQIILFSLLVVFFCIRLRIVRKHFKKEEAQHYADMQQYYNDLLTNSDKQDSDPNINSQQHDRNSMNYTLEPRPQHLQNLNRLLKQLEGVNSYIKKIKRQRIDRAINQNDGKPIIYTPVTFTYNLVNSIRSVLFYLLLISIAISYQVIYGFGCFGAGYWPQAFARMGCWLIVAIPTICWKSKQTSRYTGPFLLVVLLYFVACMLVPSAIQHTCLCIFNDNYGWQMQDVFRFSTAFTRSLDFQNPICDKFDICHLYTTLPQNTSSSVFVNLHTGNQLKNLQFEMRNINTSEILRMNTSSLYVLDDTQQFQLNYLRNIHTVLFQNLIPGTLYELSVFNQSGRMRITNYRTPPDEKGQKLKIAVGGDIGLTKNGSLITSYLQGFDPDVIFIGGDVAYDDGMRACWYSWDNFYWIFQSLQMSLNRTIPMIYSIGNHDIGFDAFTTYQMSRDFYTIPWFFFYNPQHLSSINQTKIPNYDQRKSNHYHVIGNTVHLILDSGYDQTYQSQTQFMKTTSQKFNKYYKFANYHNPIYPSCNFSIPQQNGYDVISNGTTYWTPIFDQYNFTASFQHHNHHRKMTKKIKNNIAVQKDQKGTRYVGDGSWGVFYNQCTQQYITKSPQLFEDFDKEGSSNHIWQITIQNIGGKSTINYTAVNLQGVIDYQLIQELPVFQ